MAKFNNASEIAIVLFRNDFHVLAMEPELKRAMTRKMFVQGERDGGQSWE